MSKAAGHERTPEEEAFFKRNPELGRAMEALPDEEFWRRIEERRLKAKLHREEAERILDKLKRELGI